MSDDEKRPPSDGDDDYEIGYCKPPKEHQFKPGQSGNPKGRPKGAKSLASDLSEELREKVPAREFGTQKRLSKQRAILKAQVAKAMAGDTRAAVAVFSMVRELLPDAIDSDDKTPTAVEDETILAMFLDDLGVTPDEEENHGQD